jgi:spermidine synthase
MRGMRATPFRGGLGRLGWTTALCLLVSGAGSLILEIAWSRQLRLIFGSTTLAVSTILVAYMLGLGLGGLAGGRLASRLPNGFRAYARIEIAIAAYAVAVPFLLDLYPALNRFVLAPLSFWPAALVRFVLALAVLLVPTLLMGATLPILVQALVRRADGLGRQVGLLYGFNTLGGVLGVVAATFLLFPAIGLRATGWVGAGLDLAVGAAALLWLAPALERVEAQAVAPAPAAPRAPARHDAKRAAPAPLARWNPALLSYGLVGFTALIYEVAWTRALAMITGSSVYAFATILAAFLLGIGLGSVIARSWVDRLRAPLVAYGIGLGLLGLASLATFVAFGALPGVVTRMFTEHGVSSGTLLVAEIETSLFAVLGPTLILGALFPLLVRALAGDPARHGAVVGDVYFVNTIGSALGAFLAGFVLIPALGLRWTLSLAIALDFGAAAAILAWQSRRRAVGWAPCGLAAAAGLGVLLAPPAWSAESLSRGVYHNPVVNLDFGIDTEPLIDHVPDRMLYYREGVNTTISVHRTSGGIDLRIDGKTDASLLDMRTQVLCGHLPIAFGGPPGDVLVIGFASGATVGAVTLHGPGRVDVLEIEPAVLEASRFFDDVNHRPLEREQVRVVLDDARTYLSRTRATYDLVISEPSNPWISGNANLFTREFFRDASRVLRPGGRLLQWLQLYGMDLPSIGAVLRAVRTEFPFVYGFLATRESSDLLLVATREALPLERLLRWEDLPPAARADLQRFNLSSTADLWSLLRLTPAEIEVLAGNASAPNTDDNMFVELRAPWRLYAPSREVRAAFERFTRGVLSLYGPRLGADELAEISLSHLWVRDDPDMARELGAESQRRRATARGLVAGAEWRLRNDPDDAVALERLDQALAAAPDDFHARYARAKWLARRDRLDEALEDVDRALAAQPERWAARRLRMDLLLVMRRHEEARAEAERLLASPYAEFDRKLLADAALLAGVLGDFERGLSEMRRYLDTAPDSPEEWTWTARALGALGRADEARQAEVNAERAERNTVRKAHRRARWLELIGEHEEARRGLRWVVERAPDYEPARLDLRRLEAAPDAPG